MNNIIIIPIGDIDISLLDFLVGSIPGIIPCTQCKIGKKIDIPFNNLNLNRNQFMAENIIVDLLILKNKMNYSYVLGVINYDIYAPGLNFVFGQVIDKVGIISLTRLKPQFYSMPEDYKLYKKRVLTEAIHELGHMFGLPHCNNPHCAMYFSNTIKDSDRKGFNFCESCKNKLLETC